MDYLIVYIILGVISLILLITYMKCVFFEPMLINKKLYCHNPVNKGNTIIHGKHFAKPLQGTNFSFNFWIYLENKTENSCRDSNINSYVNIFSMGYEDNDVAIPTYSPQTQHHSDPGFILKVNQYSSNLKLILDKSDNHDNQDNQYVIIDALPNQKWMNISINIENKYIDIFVNGKLYSAFYSPKIIQFLPGKPMVIECSNKGFYGWISKLRYFNYCLNYKKVNSLYHNNSTEVGDMDLLWWIK